MLPLEDEIDSNQKPVFDNCAILWLNTLQGSMHVYQHFPSKSNQSAATKIATVLKHSYCSWEMRRQSSNLAAMKLNINKNKVQKEKDFCAPYWGDLRSTKRWHLESKLSLYLENVYIAGVEIV